MTAELAEAKPQTVIHPAAVVDPSSELGPGVHVGPGAYIGPGCTIGARCWIGPRATVLEHTVMGERNEVHPGAVVGGDPQDRKYNPAIRGRVIIGDQNIFREGSTINRSVGDENPTRVGNRCLFMTGAHVGHDCVVGDGVVMANGSCLAGHVRLHNGVFLSASSAVHQFCTIGEMAMFQFGAGATMHAPPFVLLANGVNRVAGLNRVGIIRSGRYSPEERLELREVFRIVYRRRSDRTVAQSLESLEDRRWSAAAALFLSFIREHLEDPAPRNRGVCVSGPHRVRGAADLRARMLEESIDA